MRMPTRLTLLSSSLMASGMLATCLPSVAQTTAPAEAASAPVSAASAPTPAPAVQPAAQASTGPAKSTGPTQLQEVVVTATKVATPASKTPLALSVLGGEELKAAGINNVIDIADNTPGLWISQNTGRAEVAIRGIVSTDTNEKGDPSAAFHVDGMYIGRPEAQLGSFFDIDRVEVLRGPQGTLYGRNATAGAINVITNKPEPKFGGMVGVEFGNYNRRAFDGMINVPVNEVLSLRAAVTTSKRDSYFNPGPNEGLDLDSRDDYAARFHALAKFSPTTSLLLTAETSHTGGGASTPVPIGNFFTGTVAHDFSGTGFGNNIQNPVYVDRGATAQLTTAAPFPRVWPTGSPRAGEPIDMHKKFDNDAFRAEFKTSLGAADLTYQFGYLKTKQDAIELGTFFGFPQFGSLLGDGKQFSNELRLSSNSPGNLKWVAGLYTYDEKLNRDTNYYTITPQPGPVFHNPFLVTVESKSKAAFGQLTYSVLENLRLTGGIRYTRDEKTGSDPLGGADPVPPATSSPNAYAVGVKYSNTSYRLGVDYDLSKAVMLYASLSTGYKAGGFGDKGLPTYNPEKLTALEVGIKGKYLDNRLQLSASAYHYDYKDMQLATVVCPDGTPNSCGNVTTNAAKSTIDGLEFEGRLLVGDNGRVNFALALNDAKFKDYKFTDSTNTSLTVDRSGQQLDKAPKATLNLGYTHTFPLASGAEIVASLGTRFSTSYMVSTTDDGGVRYTQPSYHKTDASIGFTDVTGKWTTQVFVKNIENKVTIGSLLPGQFLVSDPRTFGVRSSYAF